MKAEVDNVTNPNPTCKPIIPEFLLLKSESAEPSLEKAGQMLCLFEGLVWPKLGDEVYFSLTYHKTSKMRGSRLSIYLCMMDETREGVMILWLHKD